MTEQYPGYYLYKRIVQAKLFIDANYAENIDLNKVSNEACFSKFHFIRLFRQTYGYTPHQYLTSVRLDKAKLLLNDGMPVSQVCIAVGFESLSSFSGKFKQVVGIPPTTYLASQAARQKEINSNPLKFIPACVITQYGWDKNRNF